MQKNHNFPLPYLLLGPVAHHHVQETCPATSSSTSSSSRLNYSNLFLLHTVSEGEACACVCVCAAVKRSD